MKQKIRRLARVLYDNFGPLVAFYVVHHFWGLKPAIAASTVFTILEIALKIRRKEPITGIFKFSAILTFVFGAVDLYAQHSFLFKYEPVITNVFTAAFFGSTLFTSRSIIEDFYLKRKDAKPITRDRVAYFRILTAIWVAYFVAKAGAYFWVARNYSIDQALLIRTVLGSGTLYAMLLISIFGSKKVFPLLKSWRLLPEAEEIAVGTTPQTP